jgi:hypothetical protein
MSNPIVWMMHPLSAPTPEGIDANLARAKRWLAWLYRTFPNVDFAAAWIPCCESMSDADPAERERGLQFDCEMVRRLDGVWMVGGRISSGMERERAAAVAAGKRVIDLTALGEEPPSFTNIEDWCSQCGQGLIARSCGPTHAVRKNVRRLLEVAGAC